MAYQSRPYERSPYSDTYGIVMLSTYLMWLLEECSWMRSTWSWSMQNRLVAQCQGSTPEALKSNAHLAGLFFLRPEAEEVPVATSL
jgi:hypothetical protein